MTLPVAATHSTAWRWHSLASLLAAFTCTPACANEASLSLGVVSQIVVRGVALAGSKPSLQGTAAYYSSKRWHASLGGASLRSTRDKGWDAQFFGKLGYDISLSADWGAQIGHVHYAYPLDSELRPFERDELSVSITYRDLLTLSVTGQRNASRSETGSRASVAYDLVGRYPLQPGLALATGIGYLDLRRRAGFGYTYGHLGLSATWQAMNLELAYIATSSQAKARFGATADNRWVASVTRVF